MGTVVFDGFNARVISPRWADISALLPVAAALFDDDKLVVLLHQEASVVGGLLMAAEEALAKAETLAEPEVGPGIALVSLDGRRGLELDAEIRGGDHWTLLWWRDEAASEPR